MFNGLNRAFNKYLKKDKKILQKKKKKNLLKSKSKA